MMEVMNNVRVKHNLDEEWWMSMEETNIILGKIRSITGWWD